MKAYIDNNIIVDLELKVLSKEDLLKNVDPKIENFYYSSAHLQEAHEITGDLETKIYRLNQRFKSLSEITENNYIHHELPSNAVYEKKELPEIVYKTITQVSFAQNAMKAMMSIITEEQKSSLRQQLSISTIELNNYTPQQVVEQINKEAVIFGGLSLVGLIEKAIELHPDGKSFGLHNKIAGVFEFLDMIGYWKDKFTDKSNYARLWDSNHTYFSSFCDYFISDDRRTRNKANVAFYLYEINTKVISSKGEK